MSIKFQRRIEDFICEKCGERISGTGYTNHCSRCLYSKHVDVNPGDREETCGGLMAPIWIEFISGEYIMTHGCERCGFKRKQKVQEGDNFEEVIKISKVVAEK